jgi:hypothetical protein
LGRDGVHSPNKKVTIVRLDEKIRSMIRRRCGVVVDEEYVQEHILSARERHFTEAGGWWSDR